MVQEDHSERSRRTTNRRRLLAAVATAATGGVAGCPSVTINIGDGGDGGGGDDGGGNGGGSSDSSDGGGSSGDLTCTDVEGEYDRQEAGARPILFDFERPAVFDELEYTQGPSVAFFEGSQSTRDGSVEIEIVQVTVSGASVDEAPEQGGSGATATFNGEEVEFAGTSSGSSLAWVANLPYQVDGERRTYTTTLDLTVYGEESNDCGDALRAAATHFVDTLEFNSETTLPVEAEEG